MVEHFVATTLAGTAIVCRLLITEIVDQLSFQPHRRCRNKKSQSHVEVLPFLMNRRLRLKVLDASLALPFSHRRAGVLGKAKADTPVRL